MAQHDFNIANQTFPSFRSDLNDALQASATMSAGSSAPTTKYAYQLWFDTATDTWKVRNSGNTAWISTITTELATGNVGIGTTPSYRLHISNGSFTGTAMQLQTTGSGHNFDMVDGTGTARFRNIDGEMRLYGDLNSGGNGNIIFHAQGTTEAMRILSSGGITFNGDTAAANALDDYEEGTWTGTLEGSTTNPSTAITQTGYYTKVGNLVFAQWRLVDVNTAGASGQIIVTGLPFTADTTLATGNVMLHKGANLDNATMGITPYIAGNNEVKFFSTKDSLPWQPALHNATTNVYIYFSVTYTTEA